MEAKKEERRKELEAPWHIAARDAWNIKNDGNDSFHRHDYSAAACMYREAFRHYELICKDPACPGNVRARCRQEATQCWCNLAISLAKEGHHLSAIKAATRALGINPECKKALLLRAKYARHPTVADFSSAVRDLKTYLKRKPKDKAARKSLCRAQRELHGSPSHGDSTGDSLDDSGPPPLVGRGNDCGDGTDSSSDSGDEGKTPTPLPPLWDQTDSEDSDDASRRRTKLEKKAHNNIRGPGLVEVETDSDDSDDEKRKKKNKSRVMMTDYQGCRAGRGLAGSG